MSYSKAISSGNRRRLRPRERISPAIHGYLRRLGVSTFASELMPPPLESGKWLFLRSVVPSIEVGHTLFVAMTTNARSRHYTRVGICRYLGKVKISGGTVPCTVPCVYFPQFIFGKTLNKSPQGIYAQAAVIHAW